MGNSIFKEEKGLQVETLSDKVLDAVILAVMQRRIPFGSRLKENELARELNVSRMPVREALMRLASEGVVINTPFRGMCLMEVDAHKLDEIINVRLALEQEAFRSAIDRVVKGEADLSGPQAALEDLKEACNRHSAAHMAMGDIAYHRSVLELSGNNTLRNIWEMMARQYQMIVGIAWHVTDAQHIYEAHVALHGALAEFDREKVCELLAPHILEAKEIGLGDLASPAA